LKVAATEGRFQDESWRMRKREAPFWAHVDLRALRDDDGQLRGFTHVTRDATERKRHEEVMRKNEERYRRGLRMMRARCRAFATLWRWARARRAISGSCSWADR
jgi:PAS domain-containing protein